MTRGIDRCNDRVSTDAGFSEWRPEVFVSDAIREAAALTARLRRSVSEFCRSELGVQNVRGSPEDDDPVTSITTMIDGLESEVVCAAPTSDLASLCAAALGAEPERHRSARGGQILQCMVDGLANALLDVFCGVIAAPGATPAIRRPAQLAEGRGGRTSPKDIARLQVPIEECGLRLRYLLGSSDLRTLCRSDAGDQGSYLSPDIGDEIRARLMKTEVALEAAIPDRKATLGETRSWAIGSKVELASTPRSNVLLSAGGEMLFRCEISRDGDFLALRLLDAGEGER